MPGNCQSSVIPAKTFKFFITMQYVVYWSFCLFDTHILSPECRKIFSGSLRFYFREWEYMLAFLRRNFWFQVYGGIWSARSSHIGAVLLHSWFISGVIGIAFSNLFSSFIDDITSWIWKVFCLCFRGNCLSDMSSMWWELVPRCMRPSSILLLFQSNVFSFLNCTW
jgi:hypothetical protein